MMLNHEEVIVQQLLSRRSPSELYHQAFPCKVAKGLQFTVVQAHGKQLAESYHCTCVLHYRSELSLVRLVVEAPGLVGERNAIYAKCLLNLPM